MSGRRGTRHFQLPAEHRPNSDINVTPLVDVVLVLLIIFMVVTPLMEKEIAVQIPRTEQREEPKDIPQDQVVVSVDAAGALKINAESYDDEAYTQAIARIVAAQAPGKRAIFFLANGAAPYPRLVVALDVARRAGAESLGLVVEEQSGTAPATGPQP